MKDKDSAVDSEESSSMGAPTYTGTHETVPATGFEAPAADMEIDTTSSVADQHESREMKHTVLSGIREVVNNAVAVQKLGDSEIEVEIRVVRPVAERVHVFVGDHGPGMADREIEDSVFKPGYGDSESFHLLGEGLLDALLHAEERMRQEQGLNAGETEITTPASSGHPVEPPATLPTAAERQSYGSRLLTCQPDSEKGTIVTGPVRQWSDTIKPRRVRPKALNSVTDWDSMTYAASPGTVVETVLPWSTFGQILSDSSAEYVYEYCQALREDITETLIKTLEDERDRVDITMSWHDAVDDRSTKASGSADIVAITPKIIDDTYESGDGNQEPTAIGPIQEEFTWEYTDSDDELKEVPVSVDLFAGARNESETRAKMLRNPPGGRQIVARSRGGREDIGDFRLLYQPERAGWTVTINGLTVARNATGFLRSEHPDLNHLELRLDIEVDGDWHPPVAPDKDGIDVDRRFWSRIDDIMQQEIGTLPQLPEEYKPRAGNRYGCGLPKKEKDLVEEIQKSVGQWPGVSEVEKHKSIMGREADLVAYDSAGQLLYVIEVKAKKARADVIDQTYGYGWRFAAQGKTPDKLYIASYGRTDAFDNDLREYNENSELSPHPEMEHTDAGGLSDTDVEEVEHYDSKSGIDG